jgi:hypothetical protein
MARFVTVYVQCDWEGCDTRGLEGDDTVIEKTVTLDKGPAKAFLLCEKHNEAFADVLMPLMAAGIKVEPSAGAAGKKGRKNGSGTSAVAGGAAAEGADGSGSSTSGNGHKEETFECQVPDCGRTISKRTGMAQHVTRTHNYDSLADYELQYPLN